MAPKKSIANQLRARLSPSHGHPEEDVDDDQKEFNPPLNQHGASDFDVIVGNTSRKDKGSASCSASAASTRPTLNPQDDFILQHSAQHEQLKQLCFLVSSVGSKTATPTNDVLPYTCLLRHERDGELRARQP